MAEIETWLRRSWIPAMSIELDGQAVLLNTLNTMASFAGAPEELFLAQPLVVSVDVPIPSDGEQHELRIRNDYSPLHAEYQLEVLAGPRVEAKPSADSGSESVISFKTDPEMAPGPATLASYSTVAASEDRPWIRANWVWVVITGLGIGVGLWLLVARRRDHVVRPVIAVRQSQARRKSPVAVRTIDAPDE